MKIRDGYNSITAPCVQTGPAVKEQAMFRYTETACRISTDGCLPESAALRLAERGRYGKA
ncbi:hypothetical protein [Mucilaginibacter lacusdianchii]|uniref:hypothetical protein n=1 Tax=Mucilaginibacter lacusdianchii TaxID=2684211 RepID=UPI00131B53C9|nr:hypothetical protein [Mucilaginibacter sp. JXJ CY 39]